MCVLFCFCVCLFVLCTSICGNERNDCFCLLSSLANTREKVSFNTQITARADKAAFGVGSNP